MVFFCFRDYKFTKFDINNNYQQNSVKLKDVECYGNISRWSYCKYFVTTSILCEYKIKDNLERNLDYSIGFFIDISGTI